MSSRETARKQGLKIYKDDMGEIRYVSNNYKFIRKDPARAEARAIGLPYYVHKDGTLRSVRTNAVIENPRWEYHARDKPPTYTGTCPKHGTAKFWRDTRKCVRCEKRY